jgi:peptide/nickel transport system ATP-binding protein/oligopeptide transport system ATP-binding protein
MPLLDVKGLTVSYEGRGERVVAVDEASFSLEPGEILAVVGESGSGKSSLALAIMRLLPSPPATIQARAIRFEDTDLLRASEETLRAIRGGKIAYVFQDPSTSLNPVLTIGEQLREMIELHTDRRGRQADALAVEWLSRVGIPSAQQRLNAYPHEFSGGMQQRVMLAMAMAAQPKLLVTDEPTTALDVTVQVQILRLIRDLQQRFGLSLLLVSHDLTVVERLAHRVLIMERGQIVEHGPAAQVLRQPTHPYTQMLLSARLPTVLRRGSGADG